MSNVFVSEGIWPQLTNAVRKSPTRCVVAVAYFGSGASSLLPLKKGSRLVVDASERAVGSGQTCPADLIRLETKGVKIYSVPNLHAKVFVLGRAAYIGSANVSNRSATHLVEAIVRTSETSVVRAAREFVQNHCLHELTPMVLNRLAKIYRPPKIPGGNRSEGRDLGGEMRPILPRLLLAQLELEPWSERDQGLHDAAVVLATKRRQHPRSFELDSFRWVGKCTYQRGDVVIQVLDEGGGNELMSPPGNVLHVRTRSYGKKQVSFVYLERPSRRRRNIRSVARRMGSTLKRMRLQGVIRDSSLAQALLNVWAIGP
jgi:hypothetical protein